MLNHRLFAMIIIFEVFQVFELFQCISASEFEGQSLLHVMDSSSTVWLGAICTSQMIFWRSYRARCNLNVFCIVKDSLCCTAIFADTFLVLHDYIHGSS